TIVAGDDRARAIAEELCGRRDPFAVRVRRIAFVDEQFEAAGRVLRRAAAANRREVVGHARLQTSGERPRTRQETTVTVHLSSIDLTVERASIGPNAAWQFRSPCSWSALRLLRVIGVVALLLSS